MSRWLIFRASIFLWIMGLWRRMTIGVRAILIDGDKVLLVKHSYIPGWHFPGGGVDPGEDIEGAVARELNEETGYALDGPMEFLGHYRNTIPPGRDYIAVYIGRSFRVERPFSPNREIVAVEWFDHTDLPEDVSLATRQRLAEIFDAKERSPHWRD